MKRTILEFVKKTVWLLIAGLIFAILSWTALAMMANADGEYRTIEPASIAPLAPIQIDISEDEPDDPDDWFEREAVFDESEDASETLCEAAVEENGEGNAAIDISAFLASIDPVAHSGTLYRDSHGAEAYGWELNEAVRLMMLESGAESEIDIREHCALLCKQLLYTQTVGGFDDWGTTLYGIIHGEHSYTETAPRIWTEAAVPTERVVEIFYDVWFNGYFTDFRVQCFRSTCYHTWAIAAYRIGKTYYSVNPWQDFSMFELDKNGLLIDILKQ